MGQYQGSNSLGGVSGEWIQLEMSSAQPFGSVKIIGRQSYDPLHRYDVKFFDHGPMMTQPRGQTH